MIAPWRNGLGLLIFLSIVVASAAAPAARGEERVRSPSAQSAANCQRSAFRVFIDVGHTIAVPGAMSARGVPEYEFNLRLAQDIDQALVDAGFDNTILQLTNEAPPLGLFERAARANRMRADLFIAIHHDSVPDDLLKTWQYDGRQNHFNDQFPGYAIFVSNNNADRAGSLQFGRLLGAALQARGLGYTPHYTLPLMGRRRRELIDASAGVYRYDALVVLYETHMPAVLLEAGSIVNRQEELQLASPARRASISAAVVSAVENFCAARRQHPIERQTRRRPVSRAAASTR